jgi:SPP1 gp7 family putative phage head morphogenesis protein
LQKNTDEIVNDIMALSKRSQQQARALARTVINQVGADTRESVTLANSNLFEGQEYVATLDSRTTFLCAQYDGQMFEIGQGPMPPLHFNCRSLRVDKVKKQYVIPGLVGSRPAVSLTEDGKRDIKQVGSNTKFESWFSRQPESFQRDYLGDGRFELYKRQGLKIGDFVEDNGKILTLEELRGRF